MRFVLWACSWWRRWTLLNFESERLADLTDSYLQLSVSPSSHRETMMSCHVISYHVISLYDIILHRIVLYHNLLYYIKVYYLLLYWLSYIQVQWPSSTVGPSAKLLCYYVLLLQYCSMVRHSESVYQYHEQFPKSTAYSISALTPWDATSVWSPFT